MSGLAQQIIHFFAALLLLLSFAMLTQRRILSLIKLLALQGLVLSINMAFVAYVTQQIELYITVILTLFLKVWLIPFVLHRLLIRLQVQNKIEPIVNLPTTLLIGLVLVIFAFNLSLPITQISAAVSSRNTIALALASVLISLFMMIIKRKAISQVISLLALENSLFFAASSATNGMPLVVELGMAFDVLIGLFIFGLFFFQIRDTFDSFDLHHLEKLREE